MAIFHSMLPMFERLHVFQKGVQTTLQVYTIISFMISVSTLIIVHPGGDQGAELPYQAGYVVQRQMAH